MNTKAAAHIYEENSRIKCLKRGWKSCFQRHYDYRSCFCRHSFLLQYLLKLCLAVEQLSRVTLGKNYGLHHQNLHKIVWRLAEFCTKLFLLYNIFIICTSNGGLCRLNAWRTCIVATTAHTQSWLLCSHYSRNSGRQQPAVCEHKVFPHLTYTRFYHTGGSSIPSGGKWHY